MIVCTQQNFNSSKLKVCFILCRTRENHSSQLATIAAHRIVAILPKKSPGKSAQRPGFLRKIYRQFSVLHNWISTICRKKQLILSPNYTGLCMVVGSWHKQRSPAACAAGLCTFNVRNRHSLVHRQRPYTRSKSVLHRDFDTPCTDSLIELKFGSSL